MPDTLRPPNNAHLLQFQNLTADVRLAIARRDEYLDHLRRHGVDTIPLFERSTFDNPFFRQCDRRVR